MARPPLLRATTGAIVALTPLPAAAGAHVTRCASPTASATSGDCGADPWPGAPLTSPPIGGEDVAPAPESPVHGIPAPVLGETVVAAPGRGKVLVSRPGSRRFRRLSSAALLPSGTVVDARRGRIRLTTALDEAGAFQTGRFWGSRFQIRQGQRPPA